LGKHVEYGKSLWDCYLFWEHGVQRRTGAPKKKEVGGGAWGDRGMQRQSLRVDHRLVIRRRAEGEPSSVFRVEK